MGEASEAFGQEPNTAVMICQAVLDGAPVLHVSRDEEENWRFLCGRDHAGSEACPAKLVALSTVLQRDPGLVELSDLGHGWTASRNAPGGEWARHDGYEDVVREHIREHGWHVSLVEADEDGPGFGYSIGLFHTFKKPEIILFGLPVELMHEIINSIGDEYREGRTFFPDSPVEGILEDVPVAFKAVKKENYAEFLGYGLWYYEGPDFPVLQCVWPDEKGRFPWDPAFPPKLVRLQPNLS